MKLHEELLKNMFNNKSLSGAAEKSIEAGKCFLESPDFLN